MIETELRTIKNFITAANILVIISIFVMGIPLSLIAIICSLIASKKMKALCASAQVDEQTKLFYRRKISMVMTLSFVIFAINAVTTYLMYPYYVDILNEMMGQSASSAAGSLSAGSASTGSIWG